MYSPKISEGLVKRLYKLKLEKRKIMTRLVNEAVELYLQQQEKNKDKAD